MMKVQLQNKALESSVKNDTLPLRGAQWVNVQGSSQGAYPSTTPGSCEFSSVVEVHLKLLNAHFQRMKLRI